MITFYLARHGDKIKEMGEVGLTKLGKRQSLLTGNYLKDRSIELIITSPVKRARETADIISTILNIPCVEDSRLIERISFGDIPRQTYRQYLEMCDFSVKNREFVLPNGNSSVMAGRQLESVLRDYSARKHKNLVLISHGGVIVDFIRNIISDEQLKKLSASVFEKLQVESCSITRVDYKNESFTIKQLNLISHL